MSRSEVLPQFILDMIYIGSYTSTACDTARRLEIASFQVALSERKELLEDEAHLLHRRCRIVHKFTGVPCLCGCHVPPALEVL